MGDDKRGREVIHFVGEKYDAVVEQAGKDVVGTLTASVLLDYIRHTCRTDDI